MSYIWDTDHTENPFCSLAGDTLIVSLTEPLQFALLLLSRLEALSARRPWRFKFDAQPLPDDATLPPENEFHSLASLLQAFSMSEM